MDTAPGARGIVIGDRYRVAGALRRTGLIDAVDLEADRADAACRVVGVPGDAERVDAWEDAWLAAQDAARLPRLRELVTDDEGAHWAVLEPSPTAGHPLPADVAAQAQAIGEALAAAGLDVGDVTGGMLIATSDGTVRLDGVVWLGGDCSPRMGGRILADLVPRPSAPAPEAPLEPGGWSPPRRRSSQGRMRRSRVLVPLAILAALAAAAVVLLVPARSQGTDVIAPADEPAPADVLLGSAEAPLAAATPSVVQEAPRPAASRDTVTQEPLEQVAVVTVVVTAPAPAEPVPLPEPVAPEVPAAAAVQAAGAVPALPVSSSPTLPLAASG
jgi:hypothetical protein